MNEEKLNNTNEPQTTEPSEQFGFEARVSLQPPAKVDLFGEVPVRSISFNETEIIEDILRLHVGSGQIDLDPTYSTGNFYKDLRIRPKHKYDICPQVEGVLQSDCRKMPFGADEINSIMFDPPFVVGSHNEGFKTGIIKDRFSYYKNIPELWQFYSDAMQEFYRILAPNGVMIFKCQDTVDSSKQYLSHVFIINEAVRIGFYCKDLFVYCVRNRMTDDRVQQHARKYHSYYLVFKKTNIKIEYVRRLSN